MLRGTIQFGLAMLLAGCATPGIADLPGGYYQLQPPESADPMETWEEVLVQREGTTRRFISHVRNTRSKTTLTIMDPATMATLISCTQEAGCFSRSGILRPDAISPELPLALLQLVVWPETSARKGLSPDLSLSAMAGVRTLTNGGDAVLIAEDLREGGRRITLPGYATTIRLRTIPSP